MTDFVGRRAFLAAVATWLAGDQRCFVLSGGVGSGKSTALRHVAALYPASVAHFCDPTDLSTRSPSMAARGLAEQLAGKVDGYVSALTDGRITGVADVTTAYHATVAGVLVQNFTVNASDENTWLQAVRRPLEQLVDDTGLPDGFFIVVDALDEADRYDATKLSELIAGFGLDQVRWLLSTRYPTKLVGQLGGSVRQWDFSTSQGRQESDEDVRVFLSRHLPQLSPTDQQTAVQRSDGNFLYAQLLVDMLAGTAAPVGDINLPKGLDSALHSYLRQIVHGDRDTTWLAGYQPVLAALTVIREPVTQPELKQLSGVGHPVLSHVVRRLAPLLAAGEAVTDRVALYHAAFHEFLRDQRRSDEWWCDPASAQEQLCAAFETQTRRWTDWDRLDRYGVVHLLAHAAQAGWSAREFDQLIVPGYLAQVARQPGTVATVARHIEPAIRVATAERDLGRAFTWQWLPHLLRNSLHEMLATDSAVLLIKAGQADLVVEALSMEGDLPRYAGKVVEALAAEGHVEIARATIARAQADERPQLLASAAIGVAAAHPALAWSLWREAVGDPTAPSLRYNDRLAMLLAAAPDFVERAWRLAGDDGTRRAILVVIAGRDPRLATGMAAQAGLVDAASAAWIAAAAADPTRATQLIAAHPDWLDERLPAEFIEAQRTGAVGEQQNTAEGLVLLAAALVADPDNADTRAQAERCAATLDPAASFLLGNHVALSRLDCTPLRGRPAAAFAVTALTAMIDHCLTHMTRSVTARVLGGLCGSLRVLDADAGDAAVERVTTLAGLDKTAFRIEVITRLCPVEPGAAWALTRWSNQDQASRAWVAALPPALIALGISTIAGVDARYSGSRAELTGVLATTLPAGDRATARQLLELITPTAKSVVFRIERAVVRAACGDTQGEDGVSMEMFVRYAADLHDGDALGVLAFRQRGADVVPSGGDLATNTDLLAARGQDLAIPVLACAAGALARRGDEAGALALLAECLHPDYAPISVHVARWPGIERAVVLAHQQVGSPADLVAALLRQRSIGARDGDVVEALALLAVHLGDDERQRLEQLTSHADPDIADVLALVDRICRGEPGVADDIAAFLSGGSLSRAGVLALLVPYALCRTTEAVAALTPTASGARELFAARPELAQPGLGFLVELLPAIARTQPDAAHRLALGMDPVDPVAQDVLQAVAVAVAERDWDRGRRIAETITLADSRGLALAGLAAVAVRLPDKASRRAAYLAILDTPEAGPDWPEYRYPLRGLLAALLVDPDPQPEVLVRLIPEVFGLPAAGPLALRCLAELAVLLDRSGAGDVITARIPGLADLVAGAWPSWSTP